MQSIGPVCALAAACHREILELLTAATDDISADAQHKCLDEADGAGSPMQKVFELTACQPLHALLHQDCRPVVFADLAVDVINSLLTSKVKGLHHLLLKAPGILLDEEQRP